MGKVTRRDFLTTLGVAAGGTALAFAPDAAVKAFQMAWGEDWVKVPTGPESWVTSLCRQCPGGCGIRVRMIGDRPTKIEGNPFHPVNRGRLCPKGQAGLLALNDPDRIKGPLKRSLDRGAGKWQEITWDEGVNYLVNWLKELRGKNYAHKLVLMDGDSTGLDTMLLERFLRQFGSPNYINIPNGLDYGTVDAFYLMQGIKDPIVYDMEMANYILSFETDLLQSFWSPVQVMNAFGHVRRGKNIRGKIVQVESRYSVTAAKADAWIPIKPGTEGVLALGIANFIIKEGLYNKDFVAKHTFGFEDWRDQSGVERQGYKNLVLQQFSPGAVSEITGVPLESILTVAKEFATSGHALAIGTRGDIYQQMAVHALNALVGNIDEPGGVLTVKSPPVLDLPAPEIDNAARRSLQMPPLASGSSGKFPLADNALSLFVEKVLSGQPYDVDTLLLSNCNPLYSKQQIGGLLQAMSKIPFIVSFSPYMDETTQYADLILPDHTNLEKWQSNVTYTFAGLPVVGIGKPVVTPLYDTKNTGDVIIKIAKGLGSSLAKAFPWKESQETVTDCMKKVYATNKGDIFSPEVEKDLQRELVRRGWRGPGYKNFEEFWGAIQEKGGWWNPAYSYEEWERVFRTPSRKFEFYSQILKNHLEKRGPADGELNIPGIETKGGQIFMPHWESMGHRESERDYPFHLKVFHPLVFAGSLHANDPFLQDISSFYTEQKWNGWVEISPVAAQKLGIKNGDGVWVESPLGKLQFRAKLTRGAQLDVVSIPLGLGHKSLGRWENGRGEDIGQLMVQKKDPFTGEPLMNKTKVKVYKV